jgi:choloylglycine hydrolase
MTRTSLSFRLPACAAIVALLAATPAAACTGILLKNADGTIVHGRTVEFGIPLDVDLVVVPRGYNFVGQTPLGDGKKWASKYAVTGGILFGNLAVMDGLNEKGLAAGAFYFPTMAEYAQTTDANRAVSMSAADFTNWILTQFASVDEVRAAVEGGEAIVAPTLLPGWPPQVQPFHWVVYDKSGKSIVIEPLQGKLVVIDNPVGTLTNSPNFDWHMTNLRNYITLSPRDVPAVTIDKTTFAPFGMGAGLFGLPGDFTPPSRFVRATIFSATAIPAASASDGITNGFHILNNFDIPVGAAREKVEGKTYSDMTMLTTMRDPQALRFYYRTYDDQTIRVVDLNAFDLDAKEVKKLSTHTEQPIVDMSGKFQARKTANAN